jgi:hypothetical protein
MENQDPQDIMARNPDPVDKSGSGTPIVSNGIGKLCSSLSSCIRIIL